MLVHRLRSWSNIETTMAKFIVFDGLWKPLKSYSKSWAYSRLQASFCRDIAMIVQKTTQSEIAISTHKYRRGNNSHIRLTL